VRQPLPGLRFRGAEQAVRAPPVRLRTTLAHRRTHTTLIYHLYIELGCIRTGTAGVAGRGGWPRAPAGRQAPNHERQGRKILGGAGAEAAGKLGTARKLG
jgi:hypothetical protein